MMKKLLDLKEKEDKKRFKAELETEKPAPVRSNNHKAPAAIQKYIKKRSNGNCEHPNCKKPGKQIHHTEPFAITKTHDPDKMLHLCKEHHQIIHLGYIDDSEIQLAFEIAYEQWQQIKKLPSYDIKNLINGRVTQYLNFSSPSPLTLS